MKKMVIAHSPDADDIFMYYAIKFGWVGKKGTVFENVALDIETLNTEALKGTYVITSYSIHYTKLYENVIVYTNASSNSSK